MGNTNPVNTSYKGYSGGQAVLNPTTEVQQGVPEVVALYKDYMKNRWSSWPFVKKVIALAFKMFDPKEGFSFVAQDKNPTVRDYSYRFLEDTLRYIATGKRSIDIITWIEILTDLPEASPESVDQRRRLSDTVEKFGMDIRPVKLIQGWLGQPGGLHDLVTTLHLLFGERTVRRVDTHGGGDA